MAVDPDATETTTSVGVLDRSIAVLTAVQTGARTLTEIVEATGLPRATTHRLAQALERHGLLIRGPAKRYLLGPRILSLAATASRDLPLRDVAHPVLERLARTTGESAQLYVRAGNERLCIDVAESERELRTIVGVGARLPLMKGSAGKVFLAFEASDHGKRLAQASDVPVGLAAELPSIRRRGWAESAGERERGVASVSAPVRAPGNVVLAVVSVSGPATRLGKGGACAPAVVEAAADIERALRQGASHQA